MIQGDAFLNQSKTNQLFVCSTEKANKKLQHHFEHSNGEAVYHKS